MIGKIKKKPENNTSEIKSGLFLTIRLFYQRQRRIFIKMHAGKSGLIPLTNAQVSIVNIDELFTKEIVLLPENGISTNTVE